MTDTTIQKNIITAISCLEQIKQERRVFCLFAQAVQIRGSIFGSKVAKLSGASQNNPHLSYLLVSCMKTVFWQDLLMGGELGYESNIDVLLG